MDNIQHILLFLFFFSFCSLGAQNNLSVSYTNFNTVPDFLNVCGEEDEVIVTVSLDGGSVETRENIVLTAHLFKGVELVNFNPDLSSADVFLSNGSDLNNPEFEIPDLSPNGLTNVNIAFSIKSNCEFVDTLTINDQLQVFDIWASNYDLGGTVPTTENDATSEYRDAFAIAFFTMDIINENPPAKVGECFTREVKVNNSSLDGFVSSLNYSLTQGAGVWITDIEVNGTAIDFLKEPNGLGDTLITVDIIGDFFVSNEGGDNDSFFDPDEALTIIETYCVQSCVEFTGSNHILSWGCEDAVCREVDAIDFVTIGEGSANVGFAVGGSQPNEFTGYCTEGQSTITFTNNGIEFDDGFATMTDIETGIGLGSSFELEDGGFVISSMSIAGVSIDNFESLMMLHGNDQFLTDPDGEGGLSDEDGDGYFDDLPIDQSIEISVSYFFDCSQAGETDFEGECTNDFSTGFNARILYTDACADRITRSEPNYLRPSNSNTRIENFTDPDAFAETDIFYVTHTQSRSVRFFEHSCSGQEEFLIKVVLPNDIEAVEEEIVLIKNDFTEIPLLGSSTNNDTLELTFDASFSPFLNGDYELLLAFKAACTADFGATEFPIIFEFICPDCDCNHIWYCGILPGPQLHGTDPPCDPDLLLNCDTGIQTTAFSINRTSLGFIDPTYTTHVDPEDVNLKVGISCDEVEVKVSNVVGDSPITDSIGIVLSYSNVDESNSPEPTFLFQSGNLRIVQGANEFNCPVDLSSLTNLTDTSSKMMVFELGNCLEDLGLTLTAGDSIEFVGDLSLNPNGPFSVQFRKIPDLRAYGYAVVDGEEFACDNFGDIFTIAKNQIAFDFPNSSNFPSGCQNTTLEYRLITVNNGFNEFFEGEFRPATKVDSIVFDFDPAILEAFDDHSVEVSIPGHPVFGNDFFDLPPLTDFPDGHYAANFDTLNQVPSLNFVQTFTFNLRIHLTPNCSSDIGSSLGNNLYDFDAQIHYLDRYYANFIGDGSCQENIIDSVNSLISYEDPPTFSLNPVTNTNFILLGDTAEWIIQHCNTSFESDAGLTWVAVEDASTTLTIISIEDVTDPNNPVLLPMESYGTSGSNAFAYTSELLRADGINGLDEICNFIKIKAIANKCIDVDFIARTGWNCEAYDEVDWNPELYPPCDETNLNLSLTFRDPFIDANVVDQPAVNPDICDTTTITILLRNIDRGALFDLQTQLILPLQGATLIPGSVEVAYPSSADFISAIGDPSFLNTTLQGQVYQYDDFSLLNSFLDENGLAGFNTTNPSDSNEVKIRYSFETDCDFISGGLSFYNFQGFKGCGDQSNFEAGESFPLIINGAEPDLTKLFQVNFSNNSVLVPGESATLEIQFTNLTNTPSETTDFISLSLPTDITYVPGSSISIEPLGWNILEPEIDIQSGFQVLSWQMPAGLLQNEMGSFQIQVNSPNLTCESEDQEVSLISVSRKELFCAGLDQNCEVETITSTSGFALTSLPIGNGLDVNLSTITSACFSEDEELLSIEGSIISAGFDLEGESFELQLILDENQNGVVDEGEVVIENFEIVGTSGSESAFQINSPVDIVNICNLILNLIPENATICGSIEAPLLVPNLINAGDDQVFCASELTSFNTTLGSNDCEANENYNFTWTSIPPDAVQGLSDIKVPTPTLNFEHEGILDDTLTFIVETQRPGCLGSSFDTILVIRAKGIVIEEPDVITIFPGEQTELFPNVICGTDPYNFQWSPDDGTLSGLNIPNPIASPSVSTDYFITVTNGFGCVDTSTFSVQVVTPVVAEVTPSDTTICAEESVLLSASGGEVYLWVPSQNNPSNGNLNFENGSSSPIFSNGIAGTTYEYQVIVSLAAFPDFPDTAFVTINIHDSPTAFAGDDLEICLGETINLSGAGSGGTVNSDYAYEWFPTPLFGQNTPNPVVQPGLTTEYILQITDDNGCIASDTVIVEVNDCGCESPVVIALNTTFANCDGADGSAEILVDGDEADFTFTWQPDIGTPNSQNNFRTDLPAGNYLVTIESVLHPECPIELPIAIQNEDGPMSTLTTSPAACNDPTGSASFSPESFQYNWSDGFSGANRDDLEPGIYFVVISDSMNTTCQNFMEVVIDDVNPLTAEVDIINQPDCGIANGIAQIIINGGSGNYSYSWPSNMSIEDSLASGIYTVTVTDLGSSGCELPVIFALTDNVPGLEINQFETTAVSCFGALDGAIDYSLELDPLVSLPIDTIISNGLLNFENGSLSGGSYCLIFEDANDCVIGVNCFDIIEPAPLMIETEVFNDCGNGGAINITVNGGSPLYSFNWENVPNNPSFADQDNLPTGFYSVTVTDINDCSISLDSIFVDECPQCEVFDAEGLVYIQSESCGGTGALCLQINEDDLENAYILDNNNLYEGEFENCGFQFEGSYNVTTLFGQGNSGPYELVNWSGIGQNLSLTFNNLDELVDIMNTLDPAAGWTLDFPFINGGVEGTNYGQMEVLVTNLGLTSFIGFNAQFVPTAFSINLSEGFHQVIVIDTLIGCRDTVEVSVLCTQSDTLDLEIIITDSLEVCFDLSELPTGFDTIFNNCLDGSFVEYEFSSDTACIDLTGIEIGEESACIVYCDSVGICDTTYLNITVIPLPVLCISDTIVVGQISTISFDTSGLNLDGYISQTEIACDATPGGIADFSVIDTLNLLQLEGLNVGIDTSCVMVCDTFGLCDTITICAVVLPGEIVTDTIETINDTVVFCLDTLILPGIIQSIEDLCEDENGTSVVFEFDPDTYCVTYYGVTEGVDTSCVLIEDDLGNLALTTFVIEAIEINAEIVCDTIAINDEIVFCVDTTELPGNIIEIYNDCPDEGTGSVDFFENFLTYCVQYKGKTLGQDSACIIICDDLGFCDTTLFCVFVEEVFEPPIANVDVDSTESGTPLVLDIKMNDTLRGGTPLVRITKPPDMGEVIVNLDCSITYIPFEPFCDRVDNFIYELCIEGTNLCDTAIVYIDVLCQELTVFNAVSPNGDGINDVFWIGKIDEFPNSTLTVYNRWGNLVYKSANYNNEWPGVWADEKDLPDGTYFYILEWKDNNQVDRIQRGAIEIHR